MVKMVGQQVVKARIRGIVGPDAVAEVGKALFVAADSIKTDAQRSITEGAVSGKGHVPSSPGEPPNADTHALDRQIESELVEPLKAIVASNARHALPLEVGTSRMAARPSIGPAAKRGHDKTIRLVRDAINRVISRGA